jgi:hypothetical protein
MGSVSVSVPAVGLAVGLAVAVVPPRRCERVGASGVLFLPVVVVMVASVPPW